MQYKTVAGPVGFKIKENDSYDAAVRSYAEIIDKEAVGGWELAMIQSIPVTKQPGCLSALFGKKEETTYFNMLVFKKQD